MVVGFTTTCAISAVVNKLINLYINHYRFMVFNTTFNNFLAISWQSVLLVEETGVSGENHRHVSVASH
jgi:hypothetical protein